MQGCFATIIVIAITIFMMILIPISLSAVAVITFDWLFGTAYFSAQVVGIVALIIFIVGRIGK